jgi:hypothetical protein
LQTLAVYLKVPFPTNARDKASTSSETSKIVFMLLLAVVAAATSSARVEMPTRSWCLDTVGSAAIGDED